MTTSEPPPPPSEDTAKPAVEPAARALDALPSRASPQAPGAETSSTTPEAKPETVPALPDTPEAKRVVDARAAFDAGDFRRAREEATAALGSSDAAVRRAAEDVLSRTRIDPVQIGLFVGCLALFLGITYWFVLR